MAVLTVVFLISCSAASCAYLLDETPDIVTAYSLRRLAENYTGPILTVERTKDGALLNVTLAGDRLDVFALETWLEGSDGRVVAWHSQIPGDTALYSTGTGPRIAVNGTVLCDAHGNPHIFASFQDEFESLQATIPKALDASNLGVLMLLDYDERGADSINTILHLQDTDAFRFMAQETEDKFWFSAPTASGSYDDNARVSFGWNRGLIGVSTHNDRTEFWRNDDMIRSISTVADNRSPSQITLFPDSRGYIQEVLLVENMTAATIYDIYDDLNPYWHAGPNNTNREAVLPQQHEYQIVLYDWLETINISDVTFVPENISWDQNITDNDTLADLWLLTQGLTASRVVRGQPQWYVLDAGDGKGIEATGEVRVPHEPGSEYPGNPPRSWANEPAFLYQLNITCANGTQGNPYFLEPAIARRALVVAMVDMMQYHQALQTDGFASWGDMYGKAMLSWAETYRWTKDVLDEQTRHAFEQGIGFFLDQMIETGPRAVNTNMDMFAVHGAADFYASTDNETLKNKSLAAVKRFLLGHIDGELGVKHSVFKTSGYDGGVFGPAGYIMEGDQPDIFYQGESIYHLTGALAAVTDRETASIDANWSFLLDILDRMEQWQTYQVFYDPGRYHDEISGPNGTNVYYAGAGFSGRTGAGVPSGQADDAWKHYTLVDIVPSGKARYTLNLESSLPSPEEMKNAVISSLSDISDKMQDIDNSTPDVWSGWSPWTKKTPYMPAKGWYTRALHLNRTLLQPPVQDTATYNKKFGGYPTGDEYWAYKGTDNTTSFGFFVEAHAHQGYFDGWYGGKIETFWTDGTGIIIINRHGKAGCDQSTEDSACYRNLESKAAHHVWGRDEHGNGFTTLLLRGQDLQRNVSFDIDSERPTVSVRNIFNDPSHDPDSTLSGEQTGAELNGSFNVTNTFMALADGVEVTHSIETDGVDELTALWAAIPVNLRLNSDIRVGDRLQQLYDDTSIEYWKDDRWEELPEDLDADGVPEMRRTSCLRLGRDYLLGDGPQYVYIEMAENQTVRLSNMTYKDPYQTKVTVRTVHMDLHGSPGTVRKNISGNTTYRIVTRSDVEPPTALVNTSSQMLESMEGQNVSIVIYGGSGKDVADAVVLLNDRFWAALNASGNYTIPLPAGRRARYEARVHIQFSDGSRLRSDPVSFNVSEDDTLIKNGSSIHFEQADEHSFGDDIISSITTRYTTQNGSASMQLAQIWNTSAGPNTTLLRVYNLTLLQINGSLETAQIRFRVPDSWMRIHDVSLDNISMYHYTQSWEEIPLVRNDSHFLANVTDFSMYAIGITSTKPQETETDTTDQTTSPRSRGSSGSSGGYYPPPVELACLPNVSCSQWGNCRQGTRERICVDANACTNDTVQTEKCNMKPIVSSGLLFLDSGRNRSINYTVEAGVVIIEIPILPSGEWKLGNLPRGQKVIVREMKTGREYILADVEGWYELMDTAQVEEPMTVVPQAQKSNNLWIPFVVIIALIVLSYIGALEYQRSKTPLAQLQKYIRKHQWAGREAIRIRLLSVGWPVQMVDHELDTQLKSSMKNEAAEIRTRI
ncbi:MAG: PGF-pre-PGF domain-containing protein [Nanoarchaeota archaeon]